MSLPNRETITKLAAVWKSDKIILPICYLIAVLSVVDFALFLRLVVPDPPVGDHPAYTWEPIIHIIGNIISILFSFQYIFGFALGFAAYPHSETLKGKAIFLTLTGAIGIAGFGSLASFLSPEHNAKLVSAVTYSNPVNFNSVLSALASAAATARLGTPTTINVPFNTASVWSGSRYFANVAMMFEADYAIAITLCVLYANNFISGVLILVDELRGITGGSKEPEVEVEGGSPSSAAAQPEMTNA